MSGLKDLAAVAVSLLTVGLVDISGDDCEHIPMQDTSAGCGGCPMRRGYRCRVYLSAGRPTCAFDVCLGPGECACYYRCGKRFLLNKHGNTRNTNCFQNRNSSNMKRVEE